MFRSGETGRPLPRPGPGRAARRLRLAAVCSCALGFATSAWAQASPDSAVVDVSDSAAVAAGPNLDGRPIRSITIRIRNVFEPLPVGPLRFVGQLANRAHIRTREGVVRDQLILKPGQPWSEERAREATRQLRTLSFLEPQVLRAIPAGDSVDVIAETRDVWTTQPEFDLERGGGRLVGSMAFTERNLFGYGKSVSLSYRDDPVGITRSVSVSDPGVAGSRLQLNYSGSRGTSGASDGVRAVLPFYSYDSRWSFGVSALRRSGTAHLFFDNAEVASLGEHIEESQVFLGHGRRRNGTITRTTLVLSALDRRLDATLTSPGTPVPESFVGPEESIKLRRAGLEYRLWKPRYIERTGIERVDQIEDFDLGTSLVLGLGVAPEALGSSADYGDFRVRLDAGVSTPVGFGLMTSSVAGRWKRSAEEVLHISHGRWIWQSRPEHTVEAAVWGVTGFRMPRNYQAIVGGLSGLRAYPVHAVAGSRLVRWNIEDRHMLVRDVFQIVSIGSAVFLDGARGWGPGAEGTRAFQCAGVGVRLAPPRAAIGPVIRADLAWPISPTRDGRREPVLSIGSSKAF
jgi:hypothetical protein